ncbi:MAG TPA: hypothetical protein DCG14_03310, partial [Phycisphaerales bacterium]|nr:hypothetical protein [Phycisphaerales bacterium]
LAAFDLPAPMTAVGRRNDSNVPAQSLVLLNDPFVHEMATAWATSVLENESRFDDEERARRMWRRAFAVPPTDADVRVILDHVTASSDPIEGWTDIAHALYNAKAFIHLD